MATSRKPSSDKSSKYAIAASKGFSYYLPKSAQQDLQKLLKQLPSPARSIYDEYYRDLMCSKVCASVSAAAMAKFVTESFPAIALQHNVFARKMNEEIDSNEHEGYVPVMFPVVPEPVVWFEEGNAAKTGRSVKRKRDTAWTRIYSVRGDVPDKKVEVELDAQPTTGLRPGIDARPSPSPTHVSDADDSSSTQPQPNETKPSIGTADDARHPTPSSSPANHPEQSASPDEGQQAQPPSARTNTPRPLVHSSDTSALTNLNMPLHGDKEIFLFPSISIPNTSSRSPTTHTTTTTTTTLHPSSPAEQKPLASPADTTDSAISPPQSEHHGWEDGKRALEGFEWEGRGSRWISGRGWVSAYYDDAEIGGGGRGRSAAVFRGNYWVGDDGREGEVVGGL